MYGPCKVTPKPYKVTSNVECLAAPEVPEYFPRRVVARYSGDASARMRAGTAEIESAHGRAVVGVAEHRPRREELVERERTVEDVSADHAEVAFQVEGR